MSPEARTAQFLVTPIKTLLHTTPQQRPLAKEGYGVDVTSAVKIDPTFTRVIIGLVTAIINPQELHAHPEPTQRVYINTLLKTGRILMTDVKDQDANDLLAYILVSNFIEKEKVENAADIPDHMMKEKERMLQSLGEKGHPLSLKKLQSFTLLTVLERALFSSTTDYPLVIIPHSQKSRANTLDT